MTFLAAYLYLAGIVLSRITLMADDEGIVKHRLTACLLWPVVWPLAVFIEWWTT